MSTVWTIFTSLIIMVAVRGGNLSKNNTVIMDAVAGEQFIIRTWSTNYASISVSVKRENITLLNTFLNGGEHRDRTAQGGRLVLKYDHTIKDVSLMFQNVSRVDEGLYEFDESFYRIKPLAHEFENEEFERQYGRWNLQFNVHEAGEVKRGHVGGKISMEFPTSSSLSYLYHYEEMVTVWVDSVCNEFPDTHFAGRIRCTGDAFNKVLSIVIDNVTQADTGLYKVFTDVDDSWRWFLNITDNTSVAYIGGNVTIGWFYSRQVMNHTLRIIHPKMGVMMLLPPTNVPQVRSNLKHRVKYSGDVLKCYIAFTLLHVESSDAGIYTIETKQGNTIPGRKQLSVEATAITAAPEAHTSIGKSSSVGYHYSSTITISLSISAKPSETTEQSFLSSSTIAESRQKAALLNETSAEFTNLLSSKTEPPSTQNQSFLWSLPVYIILIVVGVVGLIILMVCSLIWVQLRKINGLAAERRHSLEQCNTSSYLTPIKGERPLPIPATEEGGMSYSYATENVQSNAGIQLLHETENVGMNDYEIVHVSSHEDRPQLSHDENIIQETPENINEPCHDTSGYLTVLDAMENTLSK